MNIDDMTFGELKKIAAMFNGGQTKSESPFIGKYVICRCYAAGVHCGELVSHNGDEVQLKNSRRLWSWTANEGIALSGLAMSGLKTGKVDVMLPDIALVGVCEIIPCSNKAKESFNGA
jgi:hypothetical protein